MLLFIIYNIINLDNLQFIDWLEVIKYEITRKALKLISYYNFGVSIETKSNLITRDINLFKEECEKYGLLYKMKDIIKAYKKENSEQEQLTFI